MNGHGCGQKLIPNGTHWQPNAQEWETEFYCIIHGTIFIGHNWPTPERKVLMVYENGNYKPNRQIGEQKRNCHECHKDYIAKIYQAGNRRNLCYDPECKRIANLRCSTKNRLINLYGWERKAAEEEALKRNPWRWSL